MKFDSSRDSEGYSGFLELLRDFYSEMIDGTPDCIDGWDNPNMPIEMVTETVMKQWDGESLEKYTVLAGICAALVWNRQ